MKWVSNKEARNIYWRKINNDYLTMYPVRGIRIILMGTKTPELCRLIVEPGK